MWNNDKRYNVLIHCKKETNCQNINEIKVTKYVQLVVSECEGETVPKKQNIIYKFVQSQRIQTKKREELMHVIRKQPGKNECNGKSLLSLSIQSYAGQTHQTKGTIFSDEREGGRDKSGVKSGSFSLGSSPRHKLIHGPALKRFPGTCFNIRPSKGSPFNRKKHWKGLLFSTPQDII